MTINAYQGVLRAGSPGIVGRQNELELMGQLLDAVEIGTGNLVLVGGEAGIGKTTLVEEAARAAAERGCLVLTGACYDFTTTRPLGPWLDLLGSYRQDGELPEIPQVLRGAQSRSGEEVQPEIFNDFWTFFCAISDVSPLVVVLEDWHDADVTSLDLLRVFSRQLPRFNILILLTYRDDDLTVERPIYRMLPNFIREARAVRMDLRLLDVSSIRTLVTERYLLQSADEDRLVDRLALATDGNPLFIVEWLRNLELDQLLVRERNGWKLGDLELVPVPPLIHQVVDMRLAVLGEDVRRQLEIASVIGSLIPLDLWQTVSDISEDELGKIIARARYTHIIEQITDPDRLRFGHIIVREALYEGIALPVRRELHREIAEALTGFHDADPEIVAFHFARAGDYRAGDWLVRAGDHERVARAFNAAYEHYEAALQLTNVDRDVLRFRGWLLYRIADTRMWIDERQGLIYLDEVQEIAEETGDVALRVAVLWLRGKLRTLLGEDGYPDLEATAAQLPQLTSQERDDLSGILVRGYEIDAAEELVYRALANYSSHYGRYQEALRRAKPYLNERTGREEFPPDHHIASALAVSYTALGRPDEARLAFQDAIAVNERKHHFADMANLARLALRDVSLVYYSDWLPERKMLMETVVSAYRQSLEQGAVSKVSPQWGTLPAMLVEGEWDEVDTIANDLTRRGGHWQRAVAPVAGQLARYRGDYDGAWDRVEAAFPEGPESYPYNQYYDALLPIQRLAADVALDADDHELARSWIESYARWIDWSERVQGRVELQLLWARYYRLLGDDYSARGSAARALDHCHNPRQPLALMETHRLLADLATESGNVSDATYHIDQSLDLAGLCDAVYGKAQALLVRAEIELVVGRRDRARAALREARSICNELRALPLLDDISALFSRSRSGSSSRSTGINLTARELQVLEHVSDGLTDAEIATLLYISPRTVNQHLRSLYLKLEVHNRASAVVVATDRGLLKPGS